MGSRANLILINGPAGIGKSTIANRYIADHPLALAINADEIIASMGQWLTHEKQGRELSFGLVKVMAREHLSKGYDVVVPHLLTDSNEAQQLEQIALDNNAFFFECVLLAPKDESVKRMFDRGSWGEPGSPPLQQSDIPIIEDLYDKMLHTLDERPNTVRIISKQDDIDGTYNSLSVLLSEQNDDQHSNK